jgi:uncharacterized membrane protein YqiK
VFSTTTLIIAGSVLVGLLLLILFSSWALGLVRIADDEVGIVTKKFAFKNLETGRLVALHSEAGVQAETLAPGWHFFLWPWQYSVEKIDMIVVPEGEIAIVIANDGDSIPDGRQFADRVESKSFQDAVTFLTNGGQKGRQLAKLTTGTYRINTRLFDVITSKTAGNYGIDGRMLHVVSVSAEHVGIVTVHDGKSLPVGETAAPSVDGHHSYQDEHAFISVGGYKGLQHEVITPGTYSFNPWFVTVEIVEMTHIPIASVGVVNSFVGDIGVDVSGVDFKYGDIVENGKRGIWQTPLNPGLYPLNLRTTSVEIVPTSNFVLNWAHRSEAHNLDANLSSIKLRSRDGFDFVLDVQQILHVQYDVAPKLIARFGSMANLVQNVLEPLIGNYFRNSAQDHDMLEFISTRADRQGTARDFVTEQLRKFNVEGIDTLIGDLVPPVALMDTLQQRKIAQESAVTIDMQTDTAKRRQEFERENAIAAAQAARVTAQQNVLIAESNAEARVKEADGEANVARTQAAGHADAAKAIAAGEASVAVTKAEGESRAAENKANAISVVATAEAKSIELKGKASAAAVKNLVDAVGRESYTAVEVAKSLSSSSIRLVPDVSLGGNGTNSPADSLLSILALKGLKEIGESEGKV